MNTTTRHPTATLRLSDGPRLELRPVYPDDKPLLLEGFQHLSPRARYMRFLAPAERLTTAQLAYLSELDFHDHVAWGVVDGGHAVAVGRWVRLAGDPQAADVAITVVDDYQRRGIGTMLVQVLAVTARARGVTEFHFDVLAENRPMLNLLARLGGVRVVSDAVVHVTLDVGTIPPSSGVSGDLTHLLEEARRRVIGERQRSSSSNDAELTQ